MRKLVIGVVLVIVVSAIGLVVVGGKRAVAPQSTFTLREAKDITGLAVYYAGDSVDGLSLSTVLRDSVPKEAPSDAYVRERVLHPQQHNPRLYTHSVSFIYGSCRPSGDAGCAPPVEVQIWPACARSLSLYSGVGAPTPEPAVVRGAPAAFFEGGHRLEIQTGTSTVVIFGDTHDRVIRIADALRGVNVPVQAHVPLPPPAAGAVEGRASCGT
jgi:hypothetical protein